MKEFDLVITDENGIHARPAGLVVKAVKAYKSKATIHFGEKSSDMRKLLAMMGMGIKKGDTVKIEVEGEDEDQAAEAIKNAFVENGLA
ncbi:MAG: HPr family phosphocarrier protein [Anaerovoracaceae bacterium]|jgi:phosphocarrier protein HPr